MIPQWQDAPEWARWLAQDSDGAWHWHQCEPGPVFVLSPGQPHFWIAAAGLSEWARKTPCYENWLDTLRKRP